MCFAKACIAHQHQAFILSRGEVLRVIFQACQQLAHVSTDIQPQSGVNDIGVIAQFHGIKAGNGQAGKPLDLFPAEGLHHLVDTAAGAPVYHASVLALFAGEFWLQRIGRASAGGQQGGQFLLRLRQGGVGGGAVFAGSTGQRTVDATHPHFFLRVAQSRDHGLRLRAGVFR